MNKYSAIYCVMLALAAQPVIIPVLGWRNYESKHHNKKVHKIRRGQWKRIRYG